MLSTVASTPGKPITMVTVDMFRNDEDALACAAGHVIFRSGDAGDRMYVVLEGAVRLEIGDAELEALGPGEVFGEMALIDAAPRIATAIAATDCKVVPVDAKRFQYLVQNTPFFALQIMRVMADRLRAMDRRFLGRD